MEEIDDELDEVSEVDYEEVSGVGEADEWRRAAWLLWNRSSWWVMMIILIYYIKIICYINNILLS